MIFDKVKGLLHKKRAEDFEEPPAVEEDAQAAGYGDIDFPDDDPESRAKTVKKKAVMITGGAILIFAVAAVASNTLFGTKERIDKPLSGSGIASAVTPAEPLPDKYSDIGKYQKKKGAGGANAFRKWGTKCISCSDYDKQQVSFALCCVCGGCRKQPSFRCS